MNGLFRLLQMTCSRISAYIPWTYQSTIGHVLLHRLIVKSDLIPPPLGCLPRENHPPVGIHAIMIPPLLCDICRVVLSTCKHFHTSVFSYRMSRNESEKIRRDRLNMYIYELARIVPLITNAHKKMDKSSILRLTVNYLRIHYGENIAYYGAVADTE